MKDIELGWFAGIIDGEGSISLDPRNNSRYPRISVPSTDYSILEKCRVITGVGTITPRHSKRSIKHSPSWQWRVSGSRQTIQLLKMIEPILVCPKKKARAAFLVQHIDSLCKIGGNYTAQEIALRTKLHQEFFSLNGG